MSARNPKITNLCKTAQLTVPELLRYLNSDNIKEEQEHLYAQQKVCGAHMLNLRPIQRWITGPSKNAKDLSQ